jgi:hypothetical protein
LTPFTEITGQGKFTWNTRQQQAFDDTQATLIQDCLSRYPDHNLPFDIYTTVATIHLAQLFLQITYTPPTSVAHLILPKNITQHLHKTF